MAYPKGTIPCSYAYSIVSPCYKGAGLSLKKAFRKIYACDSQPGALANIEGEEYYLFNA